MYLILVCGPSGSGKTTIVDLLFNLLSHHKKVVKISIDQYYKSLHPSRTLLSINWDSIESVDMDLLYNDLIRISNYEPTMIPTYDYITHQRIPNGELICSDTEIVLLEGIFALYDERIRNLANLKIYVEADPYKTCFKRRYKRDSESRGRGGQSIVDQYFDHVLDGYKKFIEPTKRYADLCHVNEDDIPSEDSVFIKMIISYVLNTL